MNVGKNDYPTYLHTCEQNTLTTQAQILVNTSFNLDLKPGIKSHKRWRATHEGIFYVDLNA